jgi:hypothetical protein
MSSATDRTIGHPSLGGNLLGSTRVWLAHSKVGHLLQKENRKVGELVTEPFERSGYFRLELVG